LLLLVPWFSGFRLLFMRGLADPLIVVAFACLGALLPGARSRIGASIGIPVVRTCGGELCQALVEMGLRGVARALCMERLAVPDAMRGRLRGRQTVRRNGANTFISALYWGADGLAT
jgi:hypothetical protein